MNLGVTLSNVLFGPHWLDLEKHNFAMAKYFDTRLPVSINDNEVFFAFFIKLF
jgi:hypothetical protein